MPDFVYTILIVNICIFYNVASANSEKSTLEKNEMLGIDTFHDTKINKDTIFTRNMKIEQKNLAKGANPTERSRIDESTNPDWSYSAFPVEVKNHVQEFKKNMSECLKEVQKKDTRSIKRLSPGKESPVHGECLIACVLKRGGVIENGKINKDNLIILVGKFYSKDTKVMKKLEHNLDHCVEVSSYAKDECSLASKLNDCINVLEANNKHKIALNY